jgi:hypothetical protein
LVTVVRVLAYDLLQSVALTDRRDRVVDITRDAAYISTQANAPEAKPEKRPFGEVRRKLRRSLGRFAVFMPADRPSVSDGGRVFASLGPTPSRSG